MGFTFATEEEFPALLEKWMAETPTGEARPVERGRYGGAYMPHLERPE